MTSESVRVRIAPSPTGYLHVGTARTAIFNYLFACHHGGKFLVRIEDTDVERSKPELIEPILSALKWLGVSWDEEIVYQSKRLDHYPRFVQQLLESGHAYHSFLTPGQLEEERRQARAEKRAMRFDSKLGADETKTRIDAGEKHAIRIKIPEGETSYHDMVAGDIKRANSEIEDFVIARSDGSATYNLAVVVDDHDMGISHVIRGNDHITNTFKQVQLYRALDWQEPVFGHVPLILRPDKKKVSKRLGDKDVSRFQLEGILPEAMFNYLCLLGWSPKTDREIYDRQELVTIFNEDNFNSSNAIFDEEKLVAFNFQYIQKMSDHDLAILVAPMLVEAELSSKYWLETRWEYLRSVIRLLKERAHRLTDFIDLGGHFFSFDYGYDPKAEVKYFTPEAADILDELANRFDAVAEFKLDSVEAVLGDMANEKEMKKAALIHPTRLAVSGLPIGPGLYDILVTLGCQVVIERMRKAVDYISRKHQP